MRDRLLRLDLRMAKGRECRCISGGTQSRRQPGRTLIGRSRLISGICRRQELPAGAPEQADGAVTSQNLKPRVIGRNFALALSDSCVAGFVTFGPQM